MKKAAALTLGMGMFAALASIGPAMAAGDAAAGEKIFNKCKICHRIGPGEDDDFSIRNLTEMASAFEEGTQTFTTLLAAIAATL